jgi:hypothetical protein
MEICGKQQTGKCEKVKREETEQAQIKIAYEWKSRNLIGTVSPTSGPSLSLPHVSGVVGCGSTYREKTKS